MDEKKEDFLSKVFFKPEDRECSICGTKFHGTKNICESQACMMEWQHRWDEYYSRNPVSYPSGLIFYLDYMKDHHDDGEDAK